MKRIALVSMLLMLTIASFGRQRVENVTIVADTIYYAANHMAVNNAKDASYYRLLMTSGEGLQKKSIFRDYYTNGKLKAEGGYSFIDMNNDKNTIFEGEVKTYYPNGTEKWQGNFENGKLNGFFTVKTNDGKMAVARFENGQSMYKYFTVTDANGNSERRPVSELKSLL